MNIFETKFSSFHQIKSFIFIEGKNSHPMSQTNAIALRRGNIDIDVTPT